MILHDGFGWCACLSNVSNSGCQLPTRCPLCVSTPCLRFASLHTRRLQLSDCQCVLQLYYMLDSITFYVVLKRSAAQKNSQLLRLIRN